MNEKGHDLQVNKKKTASSGMQIYKEVPTHRKFHLGKEYH